MRTRCVLVVEMHDQMKIVKKVGVLSYIGILLQMKAIVSSQVDLHRGLKITAVDNKVSLVSGCGQ